MRLLPLRVTIAVCIFLTVFGSATGFLIPNSQTPSDSLLEVLIPAATIAAFSVVAGLLSDRDPHRVRYGALGGALTMTVSTAVFLVVISMFDRHFAAIGGRGLFFYLPVAPLVGFGLGSVAAQLRLWVARIV